MIDRFKAASPSRQFALAGLAIALVSLLLALIWLFFLRIPYQPLFTGMRDQDAATVVAELDRQKIPYQLADGGATILVPADKVDGTRLAVMREDLPIKGTVGFELFNKSDMGLTDFAQKINYQRALQGELARTIMTLDGVDSARVHLSLGEDRIFRDDRVPPKASVTIRMRDNAILADHVAQGVQRLVAAAVPQLDANNVVILDEAGDVIGNAPQALTSGGIATTPFQREKRSIEQYYESRVQMAVAAAVPRDGPTVSVRADMVTPAQGEVVPDWTPAARDFPLWVTLASTNPADPATQADLKKIVEDAIGFDPARGDTIAFTAASAPGTEGWNGSPPARRSVHPYVNPGVTALAPVGQRSWMWIMILMLGVIAMLLYALSARRRAPGLDERQRDRFVARLTNALDKEGGDVSTKV